MDIKLKNILLFICFSSLMWTQDWELVWSDEFNGNGSIDSDNWFHQTQLPSGGSWYNGEIQHYTDRIDNSYVSNGTLKIVAKEETYTDQGYTKEYTSARLNSKYAFTYGKVEIRAKLPEGIGTWPALWMLGKNIDELGAYWQTQGYGTTPWPACGEVDIMEHWGSNQNYVQSAIHTPSSYGGTINLGGQYISTASSEFHVYTIEWFEEEMVFSVDGNIHYIYDPSVYNSDTWPFDSELYLLLNIAIQPSISSNFTESSMEIDYVRVYEYQDSCADIVCDEGQTCDDGDCVDIPISPTVTFLVDMQNEDVDETGVYVSGGDPQLAGPSGLLMLDQGNGVWSLTIDISPGTYTYKFRNGFYDYWDGPGWEPDLPAECGFGEWNDRQFTFSNIDLVLGPYFFGSCEISESNDILGDVNDDGEINVIDVVLLVSNILDDTVNENGDINLDGSLNVVDVVLLVDIILNQETIPETGLFISQQYQEDQLTFFYDIEYSQRPNPYGVQYSSSRTQQEELLQDTIFLHLDLVLPPNPENKLLPMVVMIHGGGFHGGNKEQKLHYAQDYAQLGYIGCTINYRLTKQNVIQQSDENLIAAINDSVEDAMNAIRYLKTQSSIYSIDNNRIVTIGNSAGAFISLHNAIDNDESLPEQESINDYPGFSSSVSASVSTGAVFSNEALISLNFDEDDASCLIMHAEDYDSVTDTYWEDDVIPFYEAIINSGNYAALVAQPSGSHGVGVGPFEEYSEDIIPFIWNQLNLNEW